MLLCKIKAQIKLKAQYIVEKSKKVSLYGGLYIAYIGTENTVFDFYNAKSSAVADASWVEKRDTGADIAQTAMRMSENDAVAAQLFCAGKKRGNITFNIIKMSVS